MGASRGATGRAPTRPFAAAPVCAIAPRMSQNPPNLRPDLAPKPVFDTDRRAGQPTIGMVSLGCPKALVDSERILTKLRSEGYEISGSYDGADVVLVSSGSIALGRKVLGLPDGVLTLEQSQAAAAVGQIRLARAYEEMGDKEGALELLEEVVAEGTPRQQATARDMIARLG